MILYEKLLIPYEKIKYKEFVLIECDYCKKEFNKRKNKLIKGRKFIEKDCCDKEKCTKEKLSESNTIRFGVINSFQRTEVKDKIKQTNIKKYGAEYPQQNEKIKQKSKDTCLKNFGVEHALQNKDILKKAQQKSEERYGTKFPIQLEKFKKKVKSTNLKKYGIENFLSSKEIQEKIKQTNIEKYGTPFPIHKFGKTQTQITEWLNSYGFNFKSDYEVLEGKELDLYDSDKKIAIEYCGLYWHNENSPEPRGKNYHYEKYKKCKKNGIQLLTIFDDEWKNKKEIIESVILSKIGIFQKRIYARKCKVKKISKKDMNVFCDENHIQGKNLLSLVCFGLFHENELVGVIDLGRHHRKNDKDSLVLTRLCFKKGFQIVGGSSKLFSACIEYCKNNHIKNIISWSDNRWSDGKVYKNIGFTLESELKPDYYYVDTKNPKKRISKQSQKKSNSNCPENMTELEWAKSRELSRIWDCGKTRWNYKL